MGREAQARKARDCKSCGEAIYTNAEALKEHVRLCSMAIRAGLVIPGIVLPKRAKPWPKLW